MLGAQGRGTARDRALRAARSDASFRRADRSSLRLFQDSGGACHLYAGPANTRGPRWQSRACCGRWDAQLCSSIAARAPRVLSSSLSARRGADWGIGCRLKRASSNRVVSVVKDRSGMPCSRRTRARYSRGASGVVPAQRSFGEHLLHARVGRDHRSPGFRRIAQRRHGRVDGAPRDLSFVLGAHVRGLSRHGTRRRPTGSSTSKSAAAPADAADEQDAHGEDAHQGEADDRPRQPRRRGGLLLQDEHLGRQGARHRKYRWRGHHDLLRLLRCWSGRLGRSAQRLAAGDGDYADKQRQRDRDGNGSRGHGVSPRRAYPRRLRPRPPRRASSRLL